MVIGKLNPINKDDLKVGDVVGIAREVRCGWGASFRHVMVYPAKIIRITPKRTKIVTDKFGEHDKYETFYRKELGYWHRKIETAGNVFDNPELLQEESDE